MGLRLCLRLEPLPLVLASVRSCDLAVGVEGDAAEQSIRCKILSVRGGEWGLSL